MAAAQSVSVQRATWLDAIDRYLSGEYGDATAVVDVLLRGNISPTVKEALEKLSSDVSRTTEGSAERRAAVRRLQAAVAVPLECLLPLSAHVADDPRFDPLERALRDALAAIDRVRGDRSAEFETFRLWGYTGLLQYLLNSGALGELEHVAKRLRIPKELSTVSAEVGVLRGIARERTSRLITGARFGNLPYVGQPAGYLSIGPNSSNFSVGASAIRGDREVVVKRYLNDAAEWYSRVLRWAPSHDDARLHLGRTQVDLQQHTEALKTLEPLTRAPCVSPTCAMALLFTGLAHEGNGNREQAAVWYLRASGYILTRQSALAALMHLALAEGDADHTLTLAMQFRERDPMAHQIEPDAWGVYVGGRRANVNAVLTPVREAIRR